MTMPRYVTFQLEHMVKPCLNLCVGANPANIEGPGIFHCDLDRWNYHNCVQCDVHRLPFKSDAFASVLAGDCLEHFLHPVQALREMRRVAPKVVITVFIEWRLPGPGQHVEEGQRLFPPTPESFQPYRESGRFLDFYPESKQTHVPHVNQWIGRDDLLRVFWEAGLSAVSHEVDSPGVHEGHQMINHCFVLKRDT